MSYSAGRMLASKIAYSARNSAGRIYPSLIVIEPMSEISKLSKLRISQGKFNRLFNRLILQLEQLAFVGYISQNFRCYSEVLKTSLETESIIQTSYQGSKKIKRQSVPHSCLEQYGNLSKI